MLEGISPYFLRVSKLLLLSFFFVAIAIGTSDVALAQGGGADAGQFANNPAFPIGGPGTFPVPGGPNNPISPSNPGGAVGGGQDTNPAPAAQNAEIPPPQIETDCSSGFFASLNCFVINFFGSFVAIAGLTFDTAVGLFIIQFGDQYLNTNLGWTIERLWTTVRDIFNLLFIFGLVYIGFQIILGTNESQAKRTIPLLIIAGLLVNFSLFIVKFIVDFANLAAYQIYTLFSAIGANQAPATAVSNLGGLPSISTAFLNSLGVGQILSVVAVNQEFLYLIGLLVIFAVLIYVFFMGAILITIRFAVLLMYIVFSPAMFLGWVFPGMQGITDKYWRGLLGQAFFAPALLFMLYLSYRVIDGYNAAMRSSLYEINNGLVNSGANTGGVVEQQVLVGAFVDVMPFFVMVVVFLIASMVVARKMADSGGSMVMKINDYGIGKLNGALGGALGASTSFVGRNTIGRASEKLYDVNERLEGSRSGRFLKGAVTAASLGTLNERSRQNILNAGKKAKFGGSYSRSDDKSFAKEQKATQYKVGEQIKTDTIINRGIEALQRQENGRTLSADEVQSVEAMKARVAGLSKSEIEELDSSTAVSVAPYFTTNQIDVISKSEKISDANKGKIITKRQEFVSKSVQTASGAVSEKLTGLSIDQIESMDSNWIVKNAENFSESQFEDIKKSKKFNDSQKESFVAARNKFVNDTLASTGAEAVAGFKKLFTVVDANGVEKPRKPGEVAKYSDKILMNEYAFPYLSDKVLKEIATKGNLSPAQQRDLQNKILTSRIQHRSAAGYFTSTHAANNWG